MSGNILTRVPSLPYEFVSVADWVERREGGSAVDHDAPQHFHLIDYQLRITDSAIERYSRFRFQVNDASCIDNASQHLFEVDPESQRLQLHRCEIIRGDQVIDALDRDNLKVMQRETGLERQMSDGRLTIELLIDDVRAGDIVNVETTHREHAGVHPLQGSTLWRYFSTAWGVPVDHLHLRLINDTGKKVTVHQLDTARHIDTRATVAPGCQYECSEHDISAQRFPDDLPNWYWRPCLIVSNSGDWQQVCSLLYEYYHSTGVFDDPIDWQQLPLEIADSSECTLLAIVDFVQNEIRYRSDGDGVFSHTPKKPTVTLRKRAGDCKDKSMLLVAALQAAGFEACLALVNTELQDAIMKLDASPYLFDHMVVCVNYGGEQYFIDATVQHQAGKLGVRAQSNCKCALLLAPGTDSLTPIANDRNSDVLELAHHIDLSRGLQQAPIITIERAFRRHRADNMRYHFAACQSELTRQDYHDHASNEFGLKLSVLEPVHIVEDDKLQNVFRLRERYQVETPREQIDGDCFNIRTDFSDNLQVAESCTHGVAIDIDGTMRHRIRVSYPSAPKLPDDNCEIRNRWFEYGDRIVAREDGLEYVVELAPVGEGVEASEIEAFSRAAGEVRARCVTRVPLSAGRADNTRLGRMMLCWGLFVAAMVVLFR